MTTDAAERVFISYSHDSPQHAERVRQLADALRQDGIDCRIDQYNHPPEGGWPEWTERQIELADFVLLLFTKEYQSRTAAVDPETDVGRGVAWEFDIIRNIKYQRNLDSGKFIAIVFNSSDDKFVVSSLRGGHRYLIQVPSLDDDGYEDLYRRITDQPRISKPELGSKKSLPPLAPDTDIWQSPAPVFSIETNVERSEQPNIRTDQLRESERGHPTTSGLNKPAESPLSVVTKPEVDAHVATDEPLKDKVPGVVANNAPYVVVTLVVTGALLLFGATMIYSMMSSEAGTTNSGTVGALPDSTTPEDKLGHQNNEHKVTHCSKKCLEILKEGIDAFENDEIGTAQSKFELCTSDSPKFAGGFYWLARVAVAHKEWKNGLELLAEAMKRNENSDASHVLRIKLLIMDGCEEVQILQEVAALKGKSTTLDAWLDEFLNKGGPGKIYSSFQQICHDCSEPQFVMPLSK